MTNDNNCPTCGLVAKVRFSGPYKVAAWKRPALQLLSILVLGGLAALAAYAVTHENTGWLWLLIVPFLGLAILGLVVSFRGCLNCVSRIFGGV